MAHPPPSAEDDPEPVPWLPAVPAAAARTSARTEGLQNALPIGTRLHEFEILGLIGEGGFGIVYLAQDHSLGRRVAVKEYMPVSLASRDLSSTAVCVRSQRHTDTFDLGLRSFVNEARLLARFDHPALVKVFRFWEANDTAYMAMPYYEGRTLRELLSAPTATAPDEAWIRRLLAPLMDALALMHASQCYHRDVAPDNILLQPHGQPVLLDFGAARRVVGDATQALTVILKAGFAPIEQYAQGTGVAQGPWTDVYALGAVVYFIITGRAPPASVARIVHDDYLPLTELAQGRYSFGFLQGIDRCLRVRGSDRPQSIAAMSDSLGLSGGNAMSSARPEAPGLRATAAPHATPGRAWPDPADDEATVVLQGPADAPRHEAPDATPPAPVLAHTAPANEPAFPPVPQAPSPPPRVQFKPVPAAARDPAMKRVAILILLVATFLTATVVGVWPPQPGPAPEQGPQARASTPDASVLPLANTEALTPTAAGVSPADATPPTSAAAPLQDAPQAVHDPLPEATPPVRPRLAATLEEAQPARPEPAKPAKPGKAARSTRASSQAAATAAQTAPTARAASPGHDADTAADQRLIEEQNRQLDQLLQGASGPAQ